MGSGGGRSADLVSWAIRDEGSLLIHVEHNIRGTEKNGAVLRTLRQRHERKILRADVMGARTNDLAVLALLDDMRGPSRGAADHEQRREHRGGGAHQVIGH